MSQNITKEKNYNLRILSINYFYKLFLKEKKKYAPSLFCINKTTRRKRPRTVTLREFKTVIYEYFNC